MALGRKRICLTNNDFATVKKRFRSSAMKFNRTLEIFAEDSALNKHLETSLNLFIQEVLLLSSLWPVTMADTCNRFRFV